MTRLEKENGDVDQENVKHLDLSLFTLKNKDLVRDFGRHVYVAERCALKESHPVATRSATGSRSDQNSTATQASRIRVPDLMLTRTTSSRACSSSRTAICFRLSAKALKLLQDLLRSPSVWPSSRAWRMYLRASWAIRSPSLPVRAEASHSGCSR